MITKYNLVMEQSENYFNDALFTQITGPSDIYRLSKIVKLHKQSEEVLACFALNIQQEVIAYFEIARGTLNASMVSPREIFKRLYLANAATFILLHNHPSGDVTPSPSDKEVTQQLNQISNILELKMLDHVIVAEHNYTSFQELGYI